MNCDRMVSMTLFSGAATFSFIVIYKYLRSSSINDKTWDGVVLEIYLDHKFQ